MKVRIISRLGARPSLHASLTLYRVSQQVSELGWVDLDLGCSTTLLGCRVASYNSGSPAGGTPQIKVNPTQVRDQMRHPVLVYL